MSRHTITLRDLTTGAGRTGLTVTLRAYPTWTASIPGTEVTGKPGVYSFDDIPYGRYKLFINDDVETSFDNAAADGRWFGGVITQFSNDIDANGHTIKNLAEAEDDNDAVTKSQLDSKLSSADDSLTGNISAAGFRITGLPAQDEHTNLSDAASVGLILGVNSFVGQNYIHIPKNVIIVDSGLSASVAGRKYTKIQDAINYAHDATPSASNRYTIIIFPGANSAGYSENITLQSFVDLVGVCKPLVTGIISGANYNTRLTNLAFTYHGNFSINSLRAFSCSFRVTNDDTGNTLTVTSCILYDCDLINVGQAEFNPKIISGGGNLFVSCVSNINCPFTTGDRGSVASLEDVTIDFS